MNKEIISNNREDEPLIFISDRAINLYNDNKILKARIDKAIEYINKHKKPLHHYFDEPDCDYWIATNPDDILDILKGSDKE